MKKKMPQTPQTSHPLRRLLTVTGPDRPGIIAEISRIFAKQGADIEDVSMTRLEGNFAMILLARGGSATHLKEQLAEAGSRLGLFVHLEAAVQEYTDQEPNLFMSASGPNRVGIVSGISKTLARHGANITEMATRLLARTEVPVYLVRIEACVPAEKWEIMEKELAKIGRDLGVELRIEPIERADL